MPSQPYVISVSDDDPNDIPQFDAYGGSSPVHGHHGGISYTQRYLNRIHERQHEGLIDGQEAAQTAQQQAAMAIEASQPIVIRVKNNSDRTIRDVRFCRREDDHVNARNNWGNDEAIEISALGDDTYEEIVTAIGVNPLAIASTHITIINNQSQLNQTLVVVSRDAMGSSMSRLITFSVNPCAFQCHRVVNNTFYRLDCCSELLYQAVLPYAEIILHLYMHAAANYIGRQPDSLLTMPSPNPWNGGGYSIPTNSKTTKISSFTKKFIKKAKTLN